ncbi:hypothetical protein [Sporosalibacterium faouarense]|uniref:hypothetical protein n=1 Tax=Sporosalibacterium faouarense TaxID=516123 RepID=UPI00192ACCFC|nr:hypothetical protein [Sporosalibacterium faouarense]
MNEENYKELGREYEKSLKMISDRITKLKTEKEELENMTKNCHGNDSNIKERITNIEDRLKPLLIIRRNVRETGREVSNYYERSWWRSEKYTLNRRKSRRIVPSVINVFEEQIIDKLIRDKGDEELTI